MSTLRTANHLRPLPPSARDFCRYACDWSEADYDYVGEGYVLCTSTVRHDSLCDESLRPEDPAAHEDSRMVEVW